MNGHTAVVAYMLVSKVRDLGQYVYLRGCLERSAKQTIGCNCVSL
jgi:hypothetical protein